MLLSRSFLRGWYRGIGLVLLLGLGACASPVQMQMQESRMRFGEVRIFQVPSSESRLQSVVFLFSDAGGWSDDLTRRAQNLVRAGALVVGVDLPVYLQHLRESDDGCHYLISEVEEYSKEIQRQIGFSAYRTPFLAGVGEGGTLAYAALTQSPFVTVAGAMALDPMPVLHTKVPLCPGAASTPAPGGGFTYADKADLPGSWTYTFSHKGTPPDTSSPWALPTQASDVGMFESWWQGGQAHGRDPSFPVADCGGSRRIERPAPHPDPRP